MIRSLGDKHRYGRHLGSSFGEEEDIGSDTRGTRESKQLSLSSNKRLKAVPGSQ